MHPEADKNNTPRLSVTRRMTGPYNMNTYLVTCARTRKTVIIDPGGPESELVQALEKGNLDPVYLVNTHGHADQYFSTEKFKQVHDIPSCLHRADDVFFKDPEVQKKTFRAVGLPPPFPADVRLDHGDDICFGDLVLKAVHTPGHTPGSTCFLCETRLFTGDAIFVGEAGRTDLPGGNLSQLIESIKSRILVLDKSTIIHPGHHHTGMPVQSTIKKEMSDNIYITDFILNP